MIAIPDDFTKPLDPELEPFIRASYILQRNRAGQRTGPRFQLYEVPWLTGGWIYNWRMHTLERFAEEGDDKMMRDQEYRQFLQEIIQCMM